MSTFICEPGARIGGRYRLEDRVDGSSGWSAWKAIDEILARAVTVLTFDREFPRTHDAITAARAASRLTDARIAQVFDVEEDWDQPYAVMEWVGGDSLGDLLAEGPLEPARGAGIIAEGAGALAVAHAAGMAHLCLTPESLRWTPGGGVKVVGLGIDAALSGAQSDDPALTDTWGLGRLLYAALTAHWPGDDWPGLPPAPEVDGVPRSPRQVRAGVPAAIDEVARRTLRAPRSEGAAGLATPGALAAALARVAPAALAPPPGMAAMDRERPWPDSAPAPRYSRPARAGNGNGRAAPDSPRERAGASRVMVSIVVVLLLTALGVGAWQFDHRPSRSGTPPKAVQNAKRSTPPAAAILTPVSAQGFDPLSPYKQDRQDENTPEAHYAIDGNPATDWTTQYYYSALFGGLKTGAGLLLYMGPHPIRLTSLTVQFGPVPGADVQIEVGDSHARSAAALGTFTTVAQATNVAGNYTFTAHGTAAGKYVLIWFTRLPPMANPPGRFQGQVYNVTVRGLR